MTNTITHEGVEYRKIERKAVPGDTIYFTKVGGYSGVGEVLGTQFEDDDFLFDYEDSGDIKREVMWVGIGDSYDVLEPIESEPTPVEASPTVIDLLTNLSRRVFELERENKTQAYEINELYKAAAGRG